MGTNRKIKMNSIIKILLCFIISITLQSCKEENSSKKSINDQAKKLSVKKKKLPYQVYLLSNKSNESKLKTKKLSVGDLAPSLTLSNWHTGEPLRENETKKVFIVEFWATWCAPCVKMMPHMKEIQKKYSNELIIVGISREPSEKIDSFLSQKIGNSTRKKEMGYKIASDYQSKTTKDWMSAAGQGSIPTAFIVDHKGVIQYIGHPGMMEKTLDITIKKMQESKL